MHQFLREGISSSAGAQSINTERTDTDTDTDTDSALLLEKKHPFEQASTYSTEGVDFPQPGSEISSLPTSTSTDQDLLQRLVPTTVAATTLGSLHALERDNAADADDGGVDVQASPSSSLMGFLDPPSTESLNQNSHGEQEPKHRPAAVSLLDVSQTSSSPSSPFLLARKEESSPSLDHADHGEVVVIPTDEGQEEHFSGASEKKGAARAHHQQRREVVIDWQRFHAENCREFSQLYTSCNVCLGWQQGFEQAAWA